jgi:hypothetical protein
MMTNCKGGRVQEHRRCCKIQQAEVMHLQRLGTEGHTPGMTPCQMHKGPRGGVIAGGPLGPWKTMSP